MSRRKNPVPSYTLHKTSGQARVRINGKEIYLGIHGSPESFEAYSRVVAELKVTHVPQQPTTVPRPSLSTDAVILAFWKHAEQHYRRADGTSTNELSEYKQALKVLRALYGSTPADTFGPLALKAVRERMIGLKWCRGVVNQRVNRVRRVFKWAASEQLVDHAVYTALTTVAGLQRGRSAAPESKPVEPVADEVVDATLPLLNRTVRGLVRFQRLTGCRPGEACILRMCDVDATESVWRYEPKQHKTSWRGKKRTVFIGPHAQALLLEFPTADPTEYVFSPRRAVAELHAARTAARKTPRYPSDRRISDARRKASPGVEHAAHYTVTAYDRAVSRAVEAANALECRNPEFGPALPPLPRWAPNQIRHAHGTEVRRRFGLEAAGAALGHTRMSATEVYAERDEGLGVRIAQQMG